MDLINKKMDVLEEANKRRYGLLEKLLRERNEGVTFYHKDIDTIKQYVQQLTHKQNNTADMLASILNVSRTCKDTMKEQDDVL